VAGPESSAVGALTRSQSPFDPDGRSHFRRRVLAKAVRYNELLLEHLRSRLEETPRLRTEPPAARSVAPRTPTAGAPTAGAPTAVPPPRAAPPGPVNGTSTPKTVPRGPTNGTSEPNARSSKPAPKMAPQPGPENGGTPAPPSGPSPSPWIPRRVQTAAVAKPSESPWLPPGLTAPRDLPEGGTCATEETTKPRQGPPVHPLDLAPGVVPPQIANGHDRHEAPVGPVSGRPRDEIRRISRGIRVPATGVAVTLVLLASVASGTALVLDSTRESVPRPTVRQAALPAVPVASVPPRRHRRHRRHLRLPTITVPTSLSATGSSPGVR
jgi:hypothetical protein